jgi:hypothetical protein
MDVAYRPSEDVNPSPPPDAPDAVVTLGDLPGAQEHARQVGMLEDDRPYSPAALAEIEETSTNVSEDRAVRDMVSDLNKQRQRTGSIDDRGALVEIRANKNRESYKDAREAARDYTFTRNYGKAANLLIQHPGLHPDTATYLAQQEMPPAEIGLVNDKGERLEPIGRRLEPEDRQLNLTDAARFVGNAREVDALKEQQWLEQRQAQERDQAAAAELQRQQIAAAQQQAAAVHHARQQQTQQADSLARERQWLALNTQAAQMSAKERRAAEEIRKVGDWVRQNHAAITRIASNPAGNVKGYAQIKDLNAKTEGYYAELNNARQSRYLQQAAANQIWQAEHSKRYESYKNHQDKLFSERAPDMADPAKARDLRNHVTNMFRQAGFSDKDVDDAWQGRIGVPMRDYRVQLLIRKAAMFDQMQARAQNIPAQRRHLPAPQRPGTVSINRQGDINSERMAAVKRQLETATGRKAERLSVELLQLKRAAGQLST